MDPCGSGQGESVDKKRSAVDCGGIRRDLFELVRTLGELWRSFRNGKESTWLSAPFADPIGIVNGTVFSVSLQKDVNIL